jgi:hypothetical protein
MAKLIARLYTPKLSSMEYNDLYTRAKRMIEIEKAKSKAEGEVLDRIIDSLPIKPSFTPGAYAVIRGETKKLKQKAERRSRAITTMVGHESTSVNDVMISIASLQYGLRVKGIWFEKLLAYNPLDLDL